MVVKFGMFGSFEEGLNEEVTTDVEIWVTKELMELV
jgi:hypothetical protein